MGLFFFYDSTSQPQSMVTSVIESSRRYSPPQTDAITGVDPHWSRTPLRSAYW